MAWECNITNVDVVQKRADVLFTRTDDVTGDTENYSFRSVILETTAQRLALLDLVWAKHLEAVSEQSSIDDFITGLEASAKTNLEAREV